MQQLIGRGRTQPPSREDCTQSLHHRDRVRRTTRGERQPRRILQHHGQWDGRIQVRPIQGGDHARQEGKGFVGASRVAQNDGQIRTGPGHDDGVLTVQRRTDRAGLLRVQNGVGHASDLEACLREIAGDQGLGVA